MCEVQWAKLLEEMARDAIFEVVAQTQRFSVWGKAYSTSERRRGKRLHDTSDSVIAAAGERSGDGRCPVGGLQFLHPSRGDHQDVYRGREIKTGTQGRSEQPN